jgi:hypothetical protein
MMLKVNPLELPFVSFQERKWGSVTESVTRGKVMNKVPNFIPELELYPL